MSKEIQNEENNGPNVKGLTVLALTIVLLGLFWVMGPGWRLAFLGSAVATISIAIWQACDPFADAAQWIGEQFRLPGSVRGATLDAVASSMPELFSGIFFVLIAMQAADGDTVAASAEGFGATIATCAGSAVYNMILIPAAVALVIAMKRKDRPTVDVEPEVVSRDGLWFVGCEIVLIVFLSGDKMHWWMGATFLALYGFYILHLYIDAKRFRGKMDATNTAVQALGDAATIEQVIEAVGQAGHKIAPAHVLRARIDDEDTTESAEVLFGLFEVRLNAVTSWTIIAIATLAAAAACYFLVEVTRELAVVMQVPTFFVAVIVAAAASSVPDTFLSVGSGLRGDDSGAVSNAFGSNIFDICVCLSIPLLVNSYLIGWEPVSLLQDGEPISGLVGLRILLVVLTVLTLGIIWHKHQLTRNKAIVLCGLYLVFVGYAVLGSLGYVV
ncbi:MAG: sodium:calcium antiporter [Planctomycetaceae bacterium]